MKKSLLADAFGHHIWATLTLIDTCRSLSEEQLATAVPGTYGSILDTFRHIAGGDSGYLFALTGGRVSEIEESTMGVDQLRAVTEANGPEWSALLAEDLDPDTIVVRRRPDGSRSAAPLGIRLAQAVHHGTDHRSQICTALTNLGIEPPAIDVWDYAWRDGRLSETEPTS
jgi:uncharacterized damage-inducible protein DinB